ERQIVVEHLGNRFRDPAGFRVVRQRDEIGNGETRWRDASAGDLRAELARLLRLLRRRRLAGRRRLTCRPADRDGEARVDRERRDGSENGFHFGYWKVR